MFQEKYQNLETELEKYKELVKENKIISSQSTSEESSNDIGSDESSTKQVIK